MKDFNDKSAFFFFYLKPDRPLAHHPPPILTDTHTASNTWSPYLLPCLSLRLDKTLPLYGPLPIQFSPVLFFPPLPFLVFFSSVLPYVKVISLSLLVSFVCMFRFLFFSLTLVFLLRIYYFSLFLFTSDS